MSDIFEKLKKAGLEVQEDVETKPPALNGDYMAICKSLRRITKEGEYDFYSLNAEIVETVKGIDGVGRYVSKTYSMIDAKFGDREVKAEDNLIKLANDMFTAGLEPHRDTPEGFDKSCEAFEGRGLCLKISPNKKDGKVQYDKNDWPKHKVRIVAKFKDATASGGEKVSL